MDENMRDSITYSKSHPVHPITGEYLNDEIYPLVIISCNL